MHLLHEFGAQRKVLLKNHFEVDLVDLWMVVDKVDAGDEALPEALKKVAFRRGLFDLAESVPDQFHGVIEDDLEEPFLGAEVLKHGTLGNSQVLHHPVDAGLPKPVAGELVDGSCEDSLLLLTFELLESFPTSHYCITPGKW